MIEYKEDIKNLMQFIVDNSDKRDSETLTCARKLCLILNDFDFFLFIFGKILPLSKYIFEILQKKGFDAPFCSKKIDEFKKKLIEFRNEFYFVWKKVNNSNKNVSTKNKRTYLLKYQ